VLSGAIEPLFVAGLGGDTGRGLIGESGVGALDVVAAVNTVLLRILLLFVLVCPFSQLILRMLLGISITSGKASAKLEEGRIPDVFAFCTASGKECEEKGEFEATGLE
jgi:hypothetical protein